MVNKSVCVCVCVCVYMCVCTVSSQLMKPSVIVPQVSDSKLRNS